MNAPLIWIIFPILSGIVLYTLRQWAKWLPLAALFIALFLALLAFHLPIGSAIPIRLWAGLPTLTIGDSIFLLGARLTIDDNIKSILAFFYLALAIWYAASFAIRRNILFFPIGLEVVGLISAGLALNPSIYSPLILLSAALLCIPVLAPPGRASLPGPGRFLTFQVLGMGLILLANLAILSATIQGSAQANLSVPILILGLGFSMAVPVFPFHTWITMITDETSFFEKGFFILVLPTANLLILFETLIRLSSTPLIENVGFVLRAAGVLMVLFGGISAGFENQLGRAFGYAVIHQIGMSLLAISLSVVSLTAAVSTPTANIAQFAGLFLAQYAPMGIALAVWAFATHILGCGSERPGLAEMRGKLRRYPVASIGLLLSIFSLAGLPVLASFPVYLSLWSLIAQLEPSLVPLGLLGSFLLSIFGIRLLGSLIQNVQGERPGLSENGLQMALMIAGIGILLIIGLVPNIYLPHMTGLANALISPIP